VPSGILVEGTGKPDAQMATERKAGGRIQINRIDQTTIVGMPVNRLVAMSMSLSPPQDGVTPVDEMPDALTPTEIKREIPRHPEHQAVRRCLETSGLMTVPTARTTVLSQRPRADLEAEAHAMVEADHVQASAVVEETVRIPVQLLPTSEIRHLRKQSSPLHRQIIARLPLAINQAAHRLSL